MELIFVLDTSVVIHLLQGSVALNSYPANSVVYCSIITEIELLGWHKISFSQRTAVEKFLNQITVMPIDDPIKQTAIELRKTNKLKTPDAIIAATAVVLEAVLLTNDQRLLGLPGVKSSSLGG
ncbi:MAG: type II toxin-antitoxin system VapC family toxin [Candidatus Sumerlaeia bacterium]|nr:type II toxin-antitoxin system VapC family toxin [Candidatus Sumerlaeia bacterium]